MINVLITATVGVFFKQRVGLFLVLIAIIFGFFSATEHFQFALFFLNSSLGFYVLIGVWMLYTFLCVSFINHLWKRTEYRFAYHAFKWNLRKQICQFILLAGGILQPLIYYIFFLTYVAFKESILIKVWQIYGVLVLLHLVILFSAMYRIRHADISENVSSKQLKLKIKRPNNWLFWTFEWLYREKGITILLAKIGSIFVLLGTVAYYQTDIYDYRLLAIGFSLGYLLNSGISSEYYYWENAIWLWKNSLPISRLKQFYHVMVVHACIILPETCIVLMKNILDLEVLAQIYLLGLALLMLYHFYMNSESRQSDKLTVAPVIGYVCLTILILYRIPVLLLAAMSLIWAVIIFAKKNRAYLKFEK